MITDDGDTQDSQPSSESSGSSSSNGGGKGSHGSSKVGGDEMKTTNSKQQENKPSNKSITSGTAVAANKSTTSNNKTPTIGGTGASSVVGVGGQKTWTCQMCKKQFDQRVDLSKHACIEMSLRVLKKKKDVRKKRSREAHWKRKIDLSYIETTSLTHIAQNISDNLSFCLDGTLEDLKSYSREVKDYLATELGNETSLHAFVKLCFPDIIDQFAAGNSTHNHYNHRGINNNSTVSFDTNVIAKANSYFSDCNTQFPTRFELLICFCFCLLINWNYNK